MSDIDNDINDNTTSIIDLVRYAHEDQPAKMQDVFSELMNNRIYDAIQQKKAEVAGTMFGGFDQGSGQNYEPEQGY